MSTATASVCIPTPARYLNRLAKHFEHRIAVQRDEQRTTLTFPDGVCTLNATDTHLDIRIESSSAASVSRYQEVVTKHLKQVASQESFDVPWVRT